MSIEVFGRLYLELAKNSYTDLPFAQDAVDKRILIIYISKTRPFI